MIPSILLTSRVTEIDGSTTRINNAYEGTSLNSDPNLEKIFSPLKNKSIALSEAIKRLKTKSVQETNDEKRDERISGLQFLLMSFSHHPDENIRNAAVHLLGIFEVYGMEMKNESYTTESSLIHSLLNDYSKPENQAQIAMVPQCAKYVEALRAAQSDFDNGQSSYDHARAQEGTLDNATILKKEVVAIINEQLVPYLNVMAQLDGVMYGEFSRTVKQIISENNEMVLRRRKKDEPEKEQV